MVLGRRFQCELDRVFDNVKESLEAFDSLWNEVYDTTDVNQKEEFEPDLMEEIEKLLYRDQIKAWIESDVIKDNDLFGYRQALMDSLNLIEREMERFEVCENEVKTKAFSKEGSRPKAVVIGYLSRLLSTIRLYEVFA